ncbi:Crp/Fnr family transcriptional regulator [Membranicola marinus]|uniref:Crp/Fnr family transcriptional regulator n=1 Tax=Membranihabitans marinus TaxID=1227546 RepID=A0A953HLH3_9BACT|nr:Crp/Fnr family transcriptional regulator [Membranihabitans marinus]MBY5956678.1 Crp/Fnr family transcriptional regulator [Membranihabitans marinus]
MIYSDMDSNFQKYLKTEWGLSAVDIVNLEPFFHSEEAKKGDILVRKGSRGRSFYFVEEGMLRMYDISEDGREHILHFAPENWILGDRGSVYFDEPAFFYIDAIEDTLIVRFDLAMMDQLTNLCPDFRENNDLLLHNHIRHLNRRINLLQGATARTRYLNFIELYPDVLLRVPQWMVASYLGIAPESLSRVRRELAKENFKP